MTEKKENYPWTRSLINIIVLIAILKLFSSNFDETEIKTILVFALGNLGLERFVK